MEDIELSRQQITDELWRRGYLKWKLRAHQVPIYDAVWHAIVDKTNKTYVVSASRQYGKSFLMLLIATEYAIRTPNARIRFACPTQKQLEKIISDNYVVLFNDCPSHVLPQYNKGVYTFTNGSQIHLGGTDNRNYENLRGTMSHLNVLDEAGFMDDLDTVLYSVLAPQLKSTDGINVLISTPSESREHPYFKIYHRAREHGCFKEFTVYDDMSITPEQILAFANDYPDGGINSAKWKREWTCQWVADEKSVVIPEWNVSYVREVQRDEFYPYYHKYVAMDIGFQDFTAILFAYYDFRNATIVIEDEITASGPDVITDKIVQRIIDKETALWGTQKPYRRIADNNDPRYLAEFTTRHGMSFRPVTKDRLMAMVNQTRMLFAANRIAVHPRCEMTAKCCEFALWERDKDSISVKHKFAHSDTYRHYDHLAALIYLALCVDYVTNPIPQDHQISRATHFFIPQPNIQPNVKALADALVNKRSRRQF